MARFVCPSGWHLPDETEWTILTEYLGGDSVAGSLLKDTLHWQSPNIGATNKSGFTALPGGMRTFYQNSTKGVFRSNGFEGYWWCFPNLARSMYYNRKEVIRNIVENINIGLSVRCVKDK
jgi:uncharacterized protein (TIGR02145 family)